MTEYLKKSLQETDGQCPNFFLFAKISEDRLLLELPSDENGQQALTIDRHLSMQRVQVEWWDLRKFALITVNDLVETINVVVSLVSIQSAKQVSEQKCVKVQKDAPPT
ncbi:unnamed protein product, partial [Mesorhabditis belari]|uniref:Uncharacterized protein n=1 Tax=Mesorhabditis belari TaxID=2138241 RepID=A0AAF3EHY9_9BILA